MNKKELLLLLIIITGVISFITCYNTFIKDKNIIDSFDDDIINITFYNIYLNKFNYVHGFYLIPNGLFFVFLLVYLDIPTYEEIFKKLKKDLIKKIKKDLKDFKKCGLLFVLILFCFLQLQ